MGFLPFKMLLPDKAPHFLPGQISHPMPLFSTSNHNPGWIPVFTQVHSCTLLFRKIKRMVMTMCAVAPRNMVQEAPKFHFKRCLSSEDINLQDRRVEVDPLLLPFLFPLLLTLPLRIYQVCSECGSQCGVYYVPYSLRSEKQRGEWRMS